MPHRRIPDLPEIDQIGFVVSDIETSVQTYMPLFGDFDIWEPTYIEAANYRGELVDCTLHIATVRTENLEIELIQALDGCSPHMEITERGRFGMHHLRYRVDDIQSSIAAAKCYSYEVIWYKDWDETTKFAYLERPGDPLVVEFLQML